MARRLHKIQSACYSPALTFTFDMNMRNLFVSCLFKVDRCLKILKDRTWNSVENMEQTVFLCDVTFFAVTLTLHNFLIHYLIKVDICVVPRLFQDLKRFDWDRAYVHETLDLCCYFNFGDWHLNLQLSNLKTGQEVREIQSRHKNVVIDCWQTDGQIPLKIFCLSLINFRSPRIRSVVIECFYLPLRYIFTETFQSLILSF